MIESTLVNVKEHDDPQSKDVRGPSRRLWVTPNVIDRGDVRDVTLGPTVGNGESGNPGVFRP